jgi:hypothetical protein
MFSKLIVTFNNRQWCIFYCSFLYSTVQFVSSSKLHLITDTDIFLLFLFFIRHYAFVLFCFSIVWQWVILFCYCYTWCCLLSIAMHVDWSIKPGRSTEKAKCSVIELSAELIVFMYSRFSLYSYSNSSVYSILFAECVLVSLVKWHFFTRCFFCYFLLFLLDPVH